MSTQPLNTTFRFKVQRAIQRQPNHTVRIDIDPPYKGDGRRWDTPPFSPPIKGDCYCRPAGKPNWRPPVMSGWIPPVGGLVNAAQTIQTATIPRGSQTTLDKFLIVGSSLGSQLISAFGRNNTQQVSYPGASVIPNQNAYYNAQAAQYQAQQQQALQNQQLQQYYAAGNTPGSGIGQGIDGIFDWIQRNPMIVLAFGAGLYLLFRQPPGRR